MTRQSYAFFSALIVMMLGLVWLVESPDTRRGESDGQPVLDGLKDQLQELDLLRLEKGTEVVTLKKQAGAWHVQERYDYPADTVELVRFARALAESRVLEQKTALTQFHPRLGVDDAGMQVNLSAGDSTWQIVIGNKDAQREAYFVRLPTSETPSQVWLAEGDLEAESDPSGWLADDVIDIEAESVVEVKLTGAEGLVHGVRAEPDWQLVNGEAGAKLQYPSVVNALARGLVRVKLLDVVPFQQVDLGAASDAWFRLEDDTEIRVKVAEIDGSYYLWLDNPAQKDWVFEVNKVVYESLTKTMTDFVKTPDDADEDE